jgi:hypothetical protein
MGKRKNVRNRDLIVTGFEANSRENRTFAGRRLFWGINHTTLRGGNHPPSGIRDFRPQGNPAGRSE